MRRQGSKPSAFSADEPEIFLSSLVTPRTDEERLELARAIHYLTCSADCLLDYDGIPCCIVCVCGHMNGEHDYGNRCNNYLKAPCDCKGFTPA